MPMSSVPSMPFRLESLRRSTWLAGFLLLVCLMRVGMVTACAPHDLAESLAGGAHTVAVEADDDSTSNDPSTGAAAGHCCDGLRQRDRSSCRSGVHIRGRWQRRCQCCVK